MPMTDFGDVLKAGDLADVVMIRPEEQLNSSSKALNARSGSEILNDRSDPFHSLLAEYDNVVSKTPSMGLPPKRGVRREIDLVPGTKYCGKGPHSTPVFCVRKPNGKWRIVHAFNKLNATTIPAQTPIPRKDVLQSNMVGCMMYSALGLVDGYYQLLMRASDIPLTAVSTPSGMVWEWLVMPQGLSNAPAKFNLLHGRSAVENHVDNLRAGLECMRTNKLYSNADNGIFSAEEIPFLGCFIEKRGLRADPAKVNAIGLTGSCEPERLDEVAWPCQLPS
ncbi:reverse transcriptase [Phytophthora megakarya]|uniref:Reverse transcriptase n=1 Tax=Phytophthora megakarya TaxID=4795 RepID=A0A225VHE8_9STRA|nr:reverse transcriptase [Phytophthora megakarya]